MREKKNIYRHDFTQYIYTEKFSKAGPDGYEIVKLRYPICVQAINSCTLNANLLKAYRIDAELVPFFKFIFL